MIVAYPRKTGAFAGAVQRGDSSLGAAGGGGRLGGMVCTRTRTNIVKHWKIVTTTGYSTTYDTATGKRLVPVIVIVSALPVALY
jgi:hypothetical protein